MIDDVWDQGWIERLRAIVCTMGFDNVYCYVNGNPGKGFGQLFREVRKREGENGVPIAFVQFTEAYYRDAIADRRLRDAIMEALVRVIQGYAPGAWGRSQRDRKRRNSACANLPLPGQNIEKWLGFRDLVFSELEALGPGADWCPSTKDDSFIRRAFERYWPPGLPVPSSFICL